MVTAQCVSVTEERATFLPRGSEMKFMAAQPVSLMWISVRTHVSQTRQKWIAGALGESVLQTVRQLAHLLRLQLCSCNHNVVVRSYYRAIRLIPF